MLNLNTMCPSPWIYSAPGDQGQIVYFTKMHCFFGPRNLRGPKIFDPHGRSTKKSMDCVEFLNSLISLFFGSYQLAISPCDRLEAWWVVHPVMLCVLGRRFSLETPLPWHATI